RRLHRAAGAQPRHRRGNVFARRPQKAGVAHQSLSGRRQSAAAHRHRRRMGPRHAPRLDHALCQADDAGRDGRRPPGVPDGPRPGPQAAGAGRAHQLRARG
nr:hypothetical protein [Tanacetum cinerariifolium]